MDITGLAMDLLNLIGHTTGMLDIESNQNQLKQLVELNKMNVNFLIHVPNPFRYIGKVKLKELDVLLPRASHTTDQASTGTQHDDLVAEIKVIYDQLEDARARAGQHEFDPNLIHKIRRLIEQFRGKFRLPTPPAAPRSNVDPNRLNNDGDYVVDLPIAAHPNLILVNKVKENLKVMYQILSRLNVEQIMWTGMLFPVTRNGESSSNQNELMDKLAKMTTDLIKEISEVQGHTDCMEIIKADAEIKIEPYIDGMDDSLKDICDQAAAMYKHSLLQDQRRGGGEIDQGYTWGGSFHKDIFNGDSDAVERFLQENPLALTTRITVDGNTALHVAVKAEEPKIVQKLLERLRQQERLDDTRKKRNKEGKTALYIAASSGDETIAEKLVENKESVLLSECEEGTNRMLPLFVAAKYGNKKVVASFYGKMMRLGDYERKQFFPIENPTDEMAKALTRQWTLLLVNLIYNDDYDNASKVIERFPHLALNKYTGVETPLFALAQRPSLGANVTFNDKASKFSSPTFVRGNKMDDGTASKASKLLEEIILTIKDWESHKPELSVAFFKAAEVGSVGFVAKFIKSHHAMLNWLNDLHQNIFHVAIINRQENIFNLIYGLKRSEKNDQTGTADNKNNWMLHLVGNLAPAYRLNQVSGPAMQLQRELQWFQAVKELVPNISIDAKNLYNMTPQELFAEKHKDLMKDGEKWMRKTASSGSIVATLITTVVFAAGFTVPGGDDPLSGYPLFVKHISFLLFAIADLVALITSSISVLLFLSILTSRFTEEDFLKFLPIRLFWGLFLLFLSMSAMMFAFCDAIYIIIQKQYHWFCIPIIAVAGFIPLFLFFLVMYPLPFDLRRATTNSIFDKSSRHMYY